MRSIVAARSRRRPRRVKPIAAEGHRPASISAPYGGPPAGTPRVYLACAHRAPNGAGGGEGPQTCARPHRARRLRCARPGPISSIAHRRAKTTTRDQDRDLCGRRLAPEGADHIAATVTARYQGEAMPPKTKASKAPKAASADLAALVGRMRTATDAPPRAS